MGIGTYFLWETDGDCVKFCEGVCRHVESVAVLKLCVWAWARVFSSCGDWLKLTFVNLWACVLKLERVFYLLRLQRIADLFDLTSCNKNIWTIAHMSCLKRLLTKWKQLVLSQTSVAISLSWEGGFEEHNGVSRWVTNTRPNEFAIDGCQLLTTCIANPCQEREWGLTIVNKLLSEQVFIFYTCNEWLICSI